MASQNFVQFFLLICVCLSKSQQHGESDVISLNDSNFDDLTKTGSWIIEFFAPWCTHCKQLAPIYIQAATQLKGTVNVANVDCTLSRGLQDRFEIKSFPTIKFWIEGENRTYRGARTLDAMVDFGRAMMQPPVEKVTGKELSKVLKEHPVAFLFLGDKGPAFRLFQELAYKLQGQFKFLAEESAFSGDTKKDKKDKGLYAQVGAKSADDPQVVELSRGGDKDKYAGPWTLEGLRAFIMAHKLPLVSEISGTNFDDVTTTGRLTVFAVTKKDDSTTDNYLKELAKLAKLYKDEFVMANLDWNQYRDYAERFHFKASDLPTLFVLDAPNEYYWLPRSRHGSYSVDANEQQTLLDEILSGTIPAINVHPWYSPTRYTTWLTKNLSETHLIILVVVTTIAFAGLLIAGCMYGANDFGPEPSHTSRTSGGIQQVPAPSSKGGRKKEE